MKSAFYTLKKIVRFFQNQFKIFKDVFYLSSKENPILFEKIELTAIHFCATIVLLFVVVNCLGYLPPILTTFFPFLIDLLTFPPLTFFAKPEQTFLIYLLSLEFIINRNMFRFSNLVKFNLMLIFILEMVENLVITLWDFFYVREVEGFISKGMPVGNDFVASIFFLFFFLFFQYLYTQAYIQSLRGKFPKYPPFLRFLTDSVSFWLRLKFKR
jgi:hypothetical protein